MTVSIDMAVDQVIRLGVTIVAVLIPLLIIASMFFVLFAYIVTVFYFYSDPLQHLLLLLLSIIFCISCLILLQNYATCFNVSLNLVQTPLKEATRKHGALMTAGIITLAGFGFTAFK